MSDIDKLIDKLKKTKKTTKDEKEKKKKTNEETENTEDEELESDEVDQEEEKEKSTSTPAKSIEGENIIEQEIAILQNEGIFRRELILTLKEFIDVHKVNTQVLLDIKKLVEGDHEKKEQ